VTFGYRIFQEIGGLPPSRLLISLPPPADLSHYRSVFGNLRIEFEAAHFGLVYGPAALSAPLPQADIGLRQAMGSALAERWNALHPNLRDRVLRVLVPAVLSGSQSLETTAARLGMGPEVLTRELRRLGSSFRDLVNEARFEIACQLLVDAKLSISALSGIFGYSEVSAFTRFFTSMSGGVPPAEWRRTLSEATV
jgi:AraC-like DNA-binding protein